MVGQTHTQQEETRNQTLTVRLTGSEKRAVRFVAAALDKAESDVMRDMTIEQVMAEDARIRTALGGMGSEAA